jgi:hypothetical protein
MLRVGTRYVDDANSATPGQFAVEVHSPDYEEDWIEGMCVFHNPNAIIPLLPEMLPGAAHHFFASSEQFVGDCRGQREV